MTNTTNYPPRYRVVTGDYFHVLDTWCTDDYKVVSSWHTGTEADARCAVLNAIQEGLVK